MRSLQHLQAVTLVDVQCHADTLAAALSGVPLGRLALDWCNVLFEGQQADDRARGCKTRGSSTVVARACIWCCQVAAVQVDSVGTPLHALLLTLLRTLATTGSLQVYERCWHGIHVRHLQLRGNGSVAVKLLKHCETVTLPVDDACLLDLGPDHLPSPSGFLRLLKGTRLRQLTVKLDDPDRVSPDELEDLDPAVTFMRGWGSANEESDLPPECYCRMDAEQLCAAANAQGLSATFENSPDAMCSPHVLTISWPDASG